MSLLAVGTKETRITLPGLDVPFLVVENVESLITDITDEDKVPLWAEIWPACRGLSRYIWERMDFNGQRVLELGCGLGLAGVVCGLKGAGITFSDFQPDALEIACRNAALNGLTGVSGYLGDWRNFSLSEQFDWIVGSDILYDNKFHSCLESIFKECSYGKGILLSHPGRRPAFQFIKDWCDKTGSLEEHDVIPVYIPDPSFPYYEIHIHKLTKG
ncbi:MAG TPA: methyltransferase [Desulfotomaculum sp.]|nr:methyltransferase [Desulfotomaculum sp.]